MLSDLIPAEDGSVIAYWVRWTGTQIFSNKHLYAQKILSDGTLQGAGPTVVFDANSVQNGYFPTGSSDSEGGAVFSWYETGGSRLAYAQRVDTDGIELWPHGGVSGAVPDPGKIAIGSAAAYNAATGETFLFWPMANSNQSQWAVYGQKLLADGTRAWGDTGVEYVPFSANQPSNLQVVLAGDGAMVVYSDRSGAAQLVGIRVDGNGAPTGAPLVVSSTLSGKSRLQAARTRGGTTLLAWSDSRSGAGDILVQNVNADGTLGLPVVIPGDVNCDGAVNFGDISPFIAAIKAGGPDHWPGPCPYASGDLNADGVVNFSDIAPFIAALKAWPHCP
ncbi:MAG: hypothetical protein IPM18_11265 [Phycisphaerales bacterium]|nr:hypothetical protein [Phycisphaerales bacterium]